MRLIATLLFISLFASSLHADSLGLLKSFNSKLAQTNSFSGEFEQEYYDFLQERSSRSKGTFIYKRPGLMKWTYAAPDELEIIIGSQKIWIVDPILENVTIQEIGQVSRLKSLTFLMEENNLSQHFKISPSKRKILNPSKESSVLYLKPRKKDPSIEELQIAIDNKKFHIQKFVVIDAYGNYRKIIFSKPKFNQKFSQKVFNFIIPKNMEIIDGLDN